MRKMSCCFKNAFDSELLQLCRAIRYLLPQLVSCCIQNVATPQLFGQFLGSNGPFWSYAKALCLGPFRPRRQGPAQQPRGLQLLGLSTRRAGGGHGRQLQWQWHHGSQQQHRRLRPQRTQETPFVKKNDNIISTGLVWPSKKPNKWSQLDDRCYSRSTVACDGWGIWGAP